MGIRTFLYFSSDEWYFIVIVISDDYLPWLGGSRGIFILPDYSFLGTLISQNWFEGNSGGKPPSNLLVCTMVSASDFPSNPPIDAH